MTGDRRPTTDDGWLSDYLLGECDEAQRAEIERRLAGDPALRDRVARLSATTDRVRDLSPAAWSVAAGGSEAPARDPDRVRAASAPGRGRPVRGWPGMRVGLAAALAAVVLFGLGLGAGALIKGGSSSAGGTPGARLALRPLPGGPPGAAGVAYLDSGGRLELVIDDLPRTGPGGYYEAWLMSSLSRLVPLASFRVDGGGTARVELRLPAPAQDYRYIDVSLQRTDAGPGHSAVSVLRGPTAIG